MTKLNFYKVDELSLHTPGGNAIKFYEVKLRSIPHSCKLIGKVSYDDYKLLEENEWMNLKKDMIGDKSASFEEVEVKIESVLNPEHFSALIANGRSSKEVATTLQEATKGDTLLDSEQWMPQIVRQPTAEYVTLWKYIDMEKLAEQIDEPGKLLSEALLKFMKEAVVQPRIKKVSPETNVEELPSKLMGVVKEAMGLLDEDGESNEFVNNIITQSLMNGNKTTKESMKGEKSLNGMITDLFQKALKEEMNGIVEEEEDIPGLYDIILDFLKEEDWPYTELENSDDIYIKFKGNSGQWHCYARIFDEAERFIFYSVLPGSVPEEKRPAFAEFFSRINFNLIIGNFEMNYDTGIVRYKTSIDVQDDGLSVDLVRNHVYANVTTVDYYVNSIVRLLKEDISPKELLEELEQAPVVN